MFISKKNVYEIINYRRPKIYIGRNIKTNQIVCYLYFWCNDEDPFVVENLFQEMYEEISIIVRRQIRRGIKEEIIKNVSRRKKWIVLT